MTVKRLPLLLWRFVWPAIVMAVAVVLCLTLMHASDLLLFTSVLWAPIVLVISAVVLCMLRWERVFSIILAGFIVWKCFPAFQFAAEFTNLCVDAPLLAVKIIRSGKPVGQRLLVLQDWSGGFAGSPFIFLIYDDSGVLRTSNLVPGRLDIPGSFPPFSDANAQLCVGRSQHFVWRFYICVI